MAAPVIADRFTEACSVVFANHNDTCGGADRESIAYLTPTQLQDIFAPGGLWAEMDAWFRTAFEMHSCGTQTYALYDWIMGNVRGGGKLLQTIKQGSSISLLQPFIYGKQESVINRDYWNITLGWLQSGYTAGSTGPLTAGDLAEGEATDRVVRVTSSNGLQLTNQYFNPGMRQFIVTTTDGTAGIGQWEVLARAAAANGTYVDVLLRDLNAGATQSNYEAAPTTGRLVQSNNNINDFEKWCHNEPNWDGKKMVPQWIKTFRRTRCIDSEYKLFYKRLMESGTNEAFKAFGDMDVSKRNAQDDLEHKKRFVNNFLFSVPADANQNIDDWQELERIETPSGFSIDPGTGGRLIALRAETDGVLNQLRKCNRVRDLQGGTLNLYEFWNEIYKMVRSRRSHGGNGKEIDFYTDSTTAANFHRGMLAYWKKESMEMLSLNLDFDKTNAMGMTYSSYRAVFPTGVKVNIIQDDAFDDWVNAGNPAILTALDIGSKGSIYWLQTGSNRKEYTTGEVDKLAPLDRDWACVMASITEHRTLISDSGAVVVECPADSWWIWNFSNATPIVTGPNTAGESPYYHDLL